MRDARKVTQSDCPRGVCLLRLDTHLDKVAILCQSIRQRVPLQNTEVLVGRGLSMTEAHRVALQFHGRLRLPLRARRLSRH